jgi:hypothetical protein
MELHRSSPTDKTFEIFKNLVLMFLAFASVDSLADTKGSKRIAIVSDEISLWLPLMTRIRLGGITRV